MKKDMKNYESPMVTLETPISSEGVLCVSGNVSDYKQEDFEW